MSILHLDTHVVVWLAAGEHSRLPDGLIQRLNADVLRISPMVRLELEYLREIGRITAEPSEVLAELDHAVGLRDDTTPFAAVVDAARALGFTRDAFDRLILAQAIAAGARLATQDRRIHAAAPEVAYWAD